MYKYMYVDPVAPLSDTDGDNVFGLKLGVMRKRLPYEFLPSSRVLPTQ